MDEDPSAVRVKRRAFNNVCHVLIDERICFNMRFPATLCVNHNGTEHKFETRRDAVSTHWDIICQNRRRFGSNIKLYFT